MIKKIAFLFCICLLFGSGEVFAISASVDSAGTDYDAATLDSPRLVSYDLSITDGGGSGFYAHVSLNGQIQDSISQAGGSGGSFTGGLGQEVSVGAIIDSGLGRVSASAWW